MNSNQWGDFVELEYEPTAIDLFSGCGGLTQGLKDAGFKVLAGIEIDELAAKTFQVNHPEVQLFNSDIKLISAKMIMRSVGIKVGELDLLAGCPPCQGFSSLRTLNGSRSIVDPRNDLIEEFTKLVKILKPKAVMLENVPGLAGDKRLLNLKDQLEGIGYKVIISIIDAQDYGVPQRRKRLVLLAGRGKFLEIPAGTNEKVSVRQAIGSLETAGQSGDLLHDVPENRSDKIKGLIKKIPMDGGSRTQLAESDQLDCHKGFDGFKDIYGRMKWDEVAPTITGGCFNPSKGRFLHPEEHRAITLREAALLQSFPKNYRILLDRGKVKAAEMIGNALPPKMVSRMALSIRNQLEGK